jgi:predicted P-loop ATPase
VSEEFPRSCVFAGSVNPVDGVGYLRDATGGRRVWPLKCEAIDVDALRRDAEQLWAEAVHLYVNNEPWWLTDAERLMAEDEQSERYEEDPWAVLIDEYVYGRHSVTIDAIMSGPLKIEPERRTKVFHKRIVDHLTRHGWKVDKSSGKTVFRNPRVLDVDAA